ncbi:myb/SANT-like DNA-binding domain-containing protein 3 [Aphis gossypii]|uniref:myb/SANT-like DNA-binding domain-containing protein 3 n=1 Tax=Aphis gossypii TaxID=80765 RepID=UPI002158A8AF|nr:myb/SANT-like DNA-binding domain-containing protein 3 [Aphis gossypii]
METSVESKRTPNFTKQEEHALLHLVQKYKHILECKTTDSIQNRKKTNTWATVENKYNKNFERIVFRTATVLKNKYLNIKKKLKKKIGDERSGIRGTGGGPYNKVEYNDSENLVSEILGEKRLGRQYSKYDDNNGK